MAAAYALHYATDVSGDAAFATKEKYETIVPMRAGREFTGMEKNKNEEEKKGTRQKEMERLVSVVLCCKQRPVR